MAVSKTKIMDPWKAKRWIPIYGPNYLKNVFIGETPTIELQKVIGREVSISLAAVIGDMKKQNVQATFKITHLDGSNALTEVKKFEVSPSYIKRQIRKGRDRIDDSFVLKTSDKKDVIIKPLFITKNKVNNSKKTLLRKLSKQELREYISNVTYGELVQDMITSKLQKTIGNSLRKICPLRSCDIRVMELFEAPQSNAEVLEQPPLENGEEAEIKEEKAEIKEEKKEETEVKAEEAPKKPKKKKAESPEPAPQ